MHQFLVLTTQGVTSGMVYAALALALVLIWRSTRIVNFAQGAMAMFTTYIALWVIQTSGSYWLGFVAALGSGLLAGAPGGGLIIPRIAARPPLDPGPPPPLPPPFFPARRPSFFFAPNPFSPPP